MSKKRDYLMDNIKALLLFLVAFGHTLDAYKGTDGIELYMMKYLYLFHMPMFAFITGYFTKNLEKARKTAVEKTLLPYLLFQGTYIIMAVIMINVGLASFNSTSFNSSIIVPSSAFYYLLAVFFWKLLAKDIMHFRAPFFLSLLLGLLISVTSMDQFHIGYGAVFSLLPFFVLGILCTQDNILKLRKIPKIIPIVVLLLGSVPAIFLPYEIHSIRMTYHSVGFNNLEGILYRIVFYIIAVLMGMAIICLMTDKKTIVSHIGVASILVYAGSTFLAPHAYLILDRMFSISNNRVVNLVCIVVFCIAVIFACSVPLFLKWYNKILECIINKVLRKVDE